ncbi:MAG TPA: CHASE3 domain-containing protein, partial [Rhodocyclaceae bacterium]|nr:CHASE3 domain-containing protein [Rhodocyclaceae bacterium]
MNTSIDSKPAQPASTRPSPWKAYALALVLTLAMLPLRVALIAWTGDRPVFILFVIPIILCAYVGGLKSGLACTALVALIADYFVMPPTYSFAIEQAGDFAQWLILILAGVLISVLHESLRPSLRGDLNESAEKKHSATERKVQVGFAFALVCLGAIGIVSYLSIAKIRENAAWVEHTHEVISHLESLYSDTMDVQSDSRNYVATNDENYVALHQQAARDTADELQHVRTLTADNAAHLQNLKILVPLITEQLAFDRHVIEVRQRDGADAARTLILAGKGRLLHDKIHDLINEMQDVEGKLLAGREQQVSQSAQIAQAVIIAGSVLAFVFVGLALIFIRRDFDIRQRAEQALRQSEESLDVTLHSIGDAVLATDTAGAITRMNYVAEQLTGWTQAEALGRPIGEVFRIINEMTRESTVIPVDKVLATGETHGLANHTILIARDGSECSIADSAAPIRDHANNILGVV